MKRLRVFAIAFAMVLSLTAGIFAISRFATKTGAESAASSCTDASCCSGGTCKMGGSCCGENASCPMKDSAQKTAHQSSASGVAAETGTKSCNRAQGQVAAEEGKSCCGSGAACCTGGGGACCKGKKMTASL